jgi:MioC protein
MHKRRARGVAGLALSPRVLQFIAMAFSSIRLLVGTMTGNAQVVAEEIQFVLDKAGLGASVLPMDDASLDDIADGALIVICTSTYGSGDVPDNARAVYTLLTETRPDLSHVRFALFGLGDSTYPQTYNFGGKKFEAVMLELGAKPVLASHFHNASGGTLPEEECLPWADELAQSILALA